MLTHAKAELAHTTNDNSRWHAVPTHLHFVVGQDREGYWLAIEMHGRGGGLFISREAALKYAEFETDHQPGAVECTERLVQLPN